jgi:acetyltransferase-like isoleucine patch superfamily enzyme
LRVDPSTVHPEASGIGAVGTGPHGDFGVAHRARGFVRRRAGLVLTRLRHPRVRFGSRCDVRRGARFLVGRGASVSFGRSCILDHGLTVECRGRLEVGEGTVFGHHCTVASDAKISIGRDCLIAEMVSIRDHDHAFSASDVPITEQGRATAPIRIGDNVWIGGKVTVTKGVTIGSNTVVGAHAVVTSDLPPDCVAVGIPARVLRHRAPESESPSSPAR